MSLRDALEGWAQQTADVICNWRTFSAPLESPRPPVVAHRGAWQGTGLIENSLPAFLKARDVGAWAIELDVRFTRDGVAVVHHDPDLERCHGIAGVLSELKFAEVRKTAPLVPTLDEVLALEGLHFMIEIKASLGSSEAATLARSLCRLRPVEHYHLLTLHPDLVRIQSAFPEAAWILVGDIWLAGLFDEAVRRRLGGVAGHYLAMTKSLISRLHDQQMKAGSGFAPNLNLFRREWANGVDWVFTNTPAKVLAADGAGI